MSDWLYPGAEFKGKAWDAEGNPVGRHEYPGDVRDLPHLDMHEGESLPYGVSAYLLNGNWYGEGPEIVLWHDAAQVHKSFPLWARSSLQFNVAVVLEAAAMKMRGAPQKDGGFYVRGSAAMRHLK